MYYKNMVTYIIYKLHLGPNFIDRIIVLLQTCFIDMAMGSLDSNTVVLAPGQMVLSQKMDMVFFYIDDFPSSKNLLHDLRTQEAHYTTHFARRQLEKKHKMNSDLLIYSFG